MAETNGDESVEMKTRELAEMTSTTLVYSLDMCGDLPVAGEFWWRFVHMPHDDRVYEVTVRQLTTDSTFSG